MNTVTLVGHVAAAPVYHCTPAGQDLSRFRLATPGRTALQEHHCLAWGPAALDLHRHLRVGERMLVRGELNYTSQGRAEVVVRGYTYLGG